MTMKILLVTCVNFHSDYGVFRPYIPLGLLSLAAMLEREGHRPEVIDLNRLINQGKIDPIKCLGVQAAVFLRDCEPDIVGFATMCDSYHLTLEIAACYRDLAPQSLIVLGGPQASATDVQTLKSFPCIDVIVRGEGEQTILEMVRTFIGHGNFSRVPGITFRNDDKIQRNVDARILANLDSLPIPAYHLYPIVPGNRIPIDVGRGCPFRCSFCSASLFWRRRYRLKSVERIIEEIKFLTAHYGVRSFSLEHDIFTLDNVRVGEFCAALSEESLNIDWTCSARADYLDERLLPEMARAGCSRVYFGIETGSPRMQMCIGKNLQLDRALSATQQAVNHGISVEASFMTGFPQEREEDLRQTLDVIFAMLHSGVESIQLHVVSPLAGTELMAHYHDQLRFDGYFHSFAKGFCADKHRDIITRFPELFSAFHYIEPIYLDRDEFKGIENFVGIMATHQFRWSLVVILEQMQDPLRLYRAWCRWRREESVVPDRLGGPKGFNFLDKSSEFLEQFAAERFRTVPYLKDLIHYEHTLFALGMGYLIKSYTDRRTSVLSPRNLGIASSVRRERTYALRTYGYDLVEIVNQMRAGKPIFPRQELTHLLFLRLSDSDGSVVVIPVQESFKNLLESCSSEASRDRMIEYLIHYYRTRSNLLRSPGRSLHLTGANEVVSRNLSF